MSTQRFSVKYEGGALRQGRMNVRDLAPALNSIGTLFEEAGYVAFGDRARIQVQVEAGFERGSFDIQLILDLVLGDTLLTEEMRATAAELFRLVIGEQDFFGLLKLLKWLRGKKPKGAVRQEDGTVQIVNQENQQVIVHNYVYNFYRNVTILRSVSQAVKPLENEGIDTIEFRVGKRVADRVTGEDLPYLLGGEEETVLSDTELETELDIVAAVFREGNKWRFSGVQGLFWASIHDPEFRKRIDTGEEFSKGDRMSVQLRQIVKKMPDGSTKIDYSITKVRGHRKGPKQQSLPESSP